MNIYLPVANISVNLFSLILLGAVSGFLSGLYGIGGGIISTPIMMFFGIPSNVVVGSVSFQLLGTSVAGTMRNISRSAVDIKASAIMVFGGLVGSTACSGIVSQLERLGIRETAVSVVFMVVITAVLLPILVEISRNAYSAVVGTRDGRKLETVRKYKLERGMSGKFLIYSSILQVNYNIFWVWSIGFLVGLISGIIGIGGGVISIPIMMYAMGVSFRSASAMSMLQIALTSMNNLAWQVRAENVDLLLGVALLISSTATVQLGVALQAKSKLSVLRVTFAILLMLVLVAFLLSIMGTLRGVG